MATDDDGNVDENLANALKTGEKLVTVGFSKAKDTSINYNKQANDMINRLKSSMLTKAKNMCAANGIEFNQKRLKQDLTVLKRQQLRIVFMMEL